MLRRLLSVAALFAGVGCASPLMTEEECLRGDWRAAGFSDGRLGRLANALDERTALCEPVGVAPDASAYAAGRGEGLAALCTAKAGYPFGRRGEAYFGVCTAETDAAFLAGFLPGRRIGAAERAFEAARREYNNAVSALDSTRAEIRSARRTLKDPDAKEKAIKRARRVLDNAPRNRQYAEERVDRAIYDLGRAEAFLDAALDTDAAWRESPEFYALFDANLEANALARAVPGIEYCSDQEREGAPTCLVEQGAIISSTKGVLCAAGPGEARFVARSERFDGETFVGARHVYDYHPHNDRGRPTRRPAGFFEAFFDDSAGVDAIRCEATP